MYRYDVVVAGAGPAGICAAVEAARSGAKVAVIERYGCVGGNLTVGYVGPLLGGTCAGTMAEEIEARVNTVTPAYYDVLPLSLEEIFIYELGGVNYEVKNIVL